MAIRGVLSQNSINFKEGKRSDSVRASKGLDQIRRALISNAKLISAQKSALPKDWRNRIFK